MGQTLTNGVYLPDEGERNCYTGLVANWRALDAHLGDANIHVTYADKEAWNNHVADTVKHVTAEDKTKWDAVTSKANDADVLHKNAADTMPETLTFLKNPTVKNEDVTRGSTTGGGSRFIIFTDANNNALGSLTVSKVSNGSTALSLRVDTTDNNDTAINSQFQFFITKSGVKVINPTVDGDIALGRASNKWSDVATQKINNIEPSSLSLPNTQNFVDISAYFTNTGTGEFNTYTPPANGWIFLRLGSISSCQAQILDSSDNILWGVSSSGSVEMLTIPIMSGLKLRTQWATGSAVNVATARFYPCKGNV